MVTADDTGPTGFRNALLQAGHLVSLGADGLYAYGSAFESIIQGVDACLLTRTNRDGAPRLYLPPLCRTEDFLATDYLTSFPHLAGTVFGFAGNDSDYTAMHQQTLNHQPWTHGVTPVGLTLVSATCQPAFELFRGSLPEEGRRVDLLGQCFRHEPSTDPTRMQSFRQREFLFLGSAEDASSFRDQWVNYGIEAMHALGLDVRPATATDPFFGRPGKLLAAHQRDTGAKIELVTDLYSERDTPATALASCNAHGTHFGRAFGITCADGATAHTSCVGFGLERLALALLRVHGLSPSGWPIQVRQAVGL
ncbi:hypothetical protein LX86_002097 [Lentzea aerocolonigenes]|nr:hypothetical protein [Lentzea aerocolonigenes]